MNEDQSYKTKYSDDGIIYKSSAIGNLLDLAQSTCEDFSAIMKQCKKWRMPVNLDRTKWMLFCKDPDHSIINYPVEFTLDGGIDITPLIRPYIRPSEKIFEIFLGIIMSVVWTTS